MRRLLVLCCFLVVSPLVLDDSSHDYSLTLWSGSLFNDGVSSGGLRAFCGTGGASETRAQGPQWLLTVFVRLKGLLNSQLTESKMIAPDPSEYSGEQAPKFRRKQKSKGVIEASSSPSLARRLSSGLLGGDKTSSTFKSGNFLRSDTYNGPNSGLTRMLEQEEKSRLHENDSRDYINEMRLRLKKYVLASFFGHVYVNGMLVLSIFSALLFIYQTYLQENNPRDKKLIDLFAMVELVLAGLFGFDWCLWLFLADNRLEQLVSFFAVIDFLTVIPVWTTYFVYTEHVELSEVHCFQDALNYMILHKKFDQIENEVEKFLRKMTLSVITLIIFDSALIRYLESETQRLPFHTWIYFLVVTISTVGYGDIKPYSTLGRFCTIFFICFAIIFVPQQSNELIEKMKRVSYYARHEYKPRGNTQHILICGDLDSTDLFDFFAELFHEDHEMTNLRAVIVQPKEPTDALHRVLRDPIFSLLIEYLEGSVLNDHDLKRAKAEEAIAIFFMGDKFSTNPDEEDTKTILQLFSVKRYLKTNISVDSRVYLQLLRPENRRHLNVHDPRASADDKKEVVVCLNEIKMGIIAKSVMFPGVSTMIFNLLTSFADDEDPVPEIVKKKKKMKETCHSIIAKCLRFGRGGSDDDDDDWTTDEDDDEINYADGLSDGSWVEEYQKGCDWEIYTTELSDLFEGATFIDVSSALYSKIGVLLFALKIRELHGKHRTRVVLNPADFRIPSKEDYLIEGFVVAKNKVQSDLRFTEESLGKDPEIESLVGGIKKALDNPNKFSMLGYDSRGMGLVSLRRSDRHARRRKNSKSKTTKKKDWQRAMNDSHFPWEENKNDEEERQKEMDNNLKKNFFIRADGPAEYAACVVKTSLLEEYPYMNNHMYLGKLSHIVILYPYDIPQHIWRRIGIFEGMLHVFGRPLEESDLLRAGVFRAAQVVILADPNATIGEGRHAKHDTTLDDADAIFTYHCIRRLNEKAKVLVEIVRYQNVQYLDLSSYCESDYKFTPQFASGNLFTSAMLDTIVCQAFYNPDIVDVLKHLITGADHLDTTQNHKSNKSKFPSSRSQNKKQSLNRSKSFGEDVNIHLIRGSALYQIDVPDKLEEKTYGSCAEYLACRGILPLGIFRGVFPNMSAGARGNKMPYVFTNPSKDVELFSCDKIFVLSQRVLNKFSLLEEDVLSHFKAISNFPVSALDSNNVPRIVELTEMILSDKNIKKRLQEEIETQRLLEEGVKQLEKEMIEDFQHCLRLLKNVTNPDGSPHKDPVEIKTSYYARAFQRMNNK